MTPRQYLRLWLILAAILIWSTILPFYLVHLQDIVRAGIANQIQSRANAIADFEWVAGMTTKMLQYLTHKYTKNYG